MFPIENLEIHVTHRCNLACESCSHYSNQGHQGNLSLSEAESWMRAWRNRIRPDSFSLVGGEPTLHPELTSFVRLARDNWPHSEIRLVTNGFFLHRHPELPSTLKATGARLFISIHHSSAEYQARLRPIYELARRWVLEHGIRLEYYRSYANWTRRYKNTGAQMEPYRDGAPRQSWKNCPAKKCRQLLDGKIYKCSPLAYLKLQDAKYSLSVDWQPYLQYQPLAPDCSDEELLRFFKRKEESYCGMCPAKPERFSLPMPLRTAPTRIQNPRPDATSTRN